MSYELAELDRRMAALIQIGTIEEVSLDSAQCRVRVGDWVSAWLKWGTLSAGAVRIWRPPSVGEQAVVFAPSGDPALGVVFAGFYTEQHEGASDNRGHVVSCLMPDGCLLEYDWQSGALRISGAKTIEAQAADKITLRCPSVVIDAASTEILGDLSVQGDISAGGTVMDGGGNSNHHEH